MELFWYESKCRPLSIGTHPSGSFTMEPSHVNQRGKQYGAVAYEKQLPEDDLFIYDLLPIAPPRELFDWELAH